MRALAYSASMVGAVMIAVAVAAPRASAQGAAPPAGTYQDRREHQQDRIAQGKKSGSLTPSETQHLEKREHHMNQQARADRRAHGGKLTPHDRAKLNREQNRTSRAIHRDKHNKAHQPK